MRRLSVVVVAFSTILGPAAAQESGSQGVAPYRPKVGDRVIFGVVPEGFAPDSTFVATTSKVFRDAFADSIPADDGKERRGAKGRLAARVASGYDYLEAVRDGDEEGAKRMADAGCFLSLPGPYRVRVTAVSQFAPAPDLDATLDEARVLMLDGPLSGEEVYTLGLFLGRTAPSPRPAKVAAAPKGMSEERARILREVADANRARAATARARHQVHSAQAMELIDHQMRAAAARQQTEAVIMQFQAAGLCGAPTDDGTPCRNRVRGGGYCYLHR